MRDTNHSIGGDLIRRFSNILTSLLALNFLTLICCIPVITTGASLTAMHGCLLKVVRKEGLQTTKDFFRLFCANWKQATLLWLPFLFIFIAAQVNVFILIAAPDVLPGWVAIPAVSAAVIAFFLFQFVMPVQAHFENMPLNTLHSAVVLSISYFPRTVLLAILWVMPMVLFWKVTLSWPLVVMFGLSLPGYFCAKLYDRVFLVLEENQNEIVENQYMNSEPKGRK